MRAASSGDSLMTSTVSPGRWSAHSMPTLPVPAPTSQSTPAEGRASLARTTACTSDMGIIPAGWADGGVAQTPGEREAVATGPRRGVQAPGAQPTRGRPPGPMSTTTERGSNRPSASSCRESSRTCSSGLPSRLQTATRSMLTPAASRTRPMASGGASGEVSTATLGPMRMIPVASARWGPSAETTKASSQGSPRRANARDTDEVAGRIWSRRRSRVASSARPMPKKPGSPDESTQTRRPRSTAREPDLGDEGGDVRPHLEHVVGHRRRVRSLCPALPQIEVPPGPGDHLGRGQGPPGLGGEEVEAVVGHAEHRHRATGHRFLSARATASSSSPSTTTTSTTSARSRRKPRSRRPGSGHLAAGSGPGQAGGSTTGYGAGARRPVGLVGELGLVQLGVEALGRQEFARGCPARRSVPRR